MIPKHLAHYRVLEKIGSGGMGVVYRAHDEILDRDVALKVLPSGMLSDESAQRRFRREALSLAKLNHPYIGGVYEFGSEAGVYFLAMELVSGVTLDARLAAGPLEQTDVLRFGAQLADGLDAAHQQGILHRDLKPSNLRLSKEGRLKILDFGLAEWTNPEGDSDPTVTNTKVSGTVAYMSPEQLRGKSADVRSDIYSAGAVLYEMATGKHPYAETSGPQLIAQILDKPPSLPTSRNRRISPALEAIILKTLDRDPDLRYQSARELRIDLERLSSGTGPVAIQHKSVWPWIALAVILAIAGILLWNPYGVRGRIAGFHSGIPSAHARRSVAVIGFRNLSGKSEQAWLSTALAEMLSTELSSGGQLRSLPGENIARMRLDLALPDSESYAPDTLHRIRKHSGTDMVVLGSYMAMGKESGDQLRVDFHLQDAVTGETLASVSETGTQPELLDLVARTGGRLRSALGIQDAVGEAASARTSLSLPSGSEAARLYAEGLSKQRVFEALAARTLLEKAIALDPKHALSHAALSDALATLGYDALSRAEAQKAFDLSTGLSREDRFMIEGRLRAVSRDWPKAIETYRTLWQFFPDNPEYALRLAGAQTSGGQGKDALETLAQLKQSSGGSSEDPRVNLAESKALDSLGSFKLSLEAAQQAVQIGQSQGARLIVAQAKSAEGWASERLGEWANATASFREARDLFTAAGDRRGAATATLLQGTIPYDKGDFAAANQAFEESLKTFREIGDVRNAARALNSLGNVAYDTDKIELARDYYQQTLTIDQETDEKSGRAGALGNLANVYDVMGDLPNTRKMNEEGLALFREIGDQRGTASTLANLGNVLVEMGELPEARKRYEEALQMQKEIGYRHGEAFAAGDMADWLTVTGDLPGARKLAEQALAIRKDLAENVNTAQSQQQLGWIAYNESRMPDAESNLREAIRVFQKEDVRDNLISSQAVLARVLLTQDKKAEATTLVATALQTARTRPSRLPQFDAMLASARVHSSQGKFAEAIKESQDVFHQATRYGYVGYQLEARLAEAQALAKSGNKSQAKTMASALRKDAHVKGYKQIEQEAANI